MKRYLIDPFNTKQYMRNVMFDSPYGVLREGLAERGVQLDTYDLGELGDADMVLCFNYNEDFYQRCVAAGLSREQLALFVFEPRVVIPEQYAPEVWDRFGQVFTFLEDKVDGKRVRLLRYPQGQTPMEQVPEFAERKHLVLINGNKYSHVPNELYSLRRQAIRHFERSADEFDLYGFMWDKGSSVLGKRDGVKALKRGRPVQFVRDVWDGRRPYTSYRGSVEDKYGTIASYRFCLCFENEKEAPGYVTEKIFDCLTTGTVPVYLGAPNITDYVPAEAMVDLRKFKGLGELEKYLRGVSEAEWAAMSRAGREYMRSEQFEGWKPEAVFGSFVDVLAPRS